jgi:hypothetical protein
MSKGLIFLGVLVILVLGIFLGYRSMYNNAVTLQEMLPRNGGMSGPIISAVLILCRNWLQP